MLKQCSLVLGTHTRVSELSNVFVTPITACTIEYYTTMSDLFLDYLDQHCIERAKN